MNEMVERVARVLRPWAWRNDEDNTTDAALLGERLASLNLARAAIEAMREPTDDMLRGAFVAMNETPAGEWKRLKALDLTPRQLFDAKMIPRWEAMIDRALRTTPTQHRTETK